MLDKFLVSLFTILLLLAEVISPVILVFILGFIAWRLIRKNWVNRIFIKLIYRKNPLVRLFYERVGHAVEEKASRILKPLAYGALMFLIVVISRALWSYVFDGEDPTALLLRDGLPSMFLKIGLIFVGLGLSASMIWSLIFIRETKRFSVYNRSLEIYFLGKYVENILNITLGLFFIVGTVYAWFLCLKKLSPIFGYLEDRLVPYVELRVDFGEMLRTLSGLLVGFRDQFQTWCVTAFLISLASFAVPYLWFKGRRFTRIFLSLFFLGTGFSYWVSSLIKRLIISEPNWIFFAVWTFSSLVTYMVFHLINVVSFNRINICRHCRAENGIHSKHCSQCGRKLIVSGKKGPSA